MAGSSPQEKAFEKLNKQVESFNPQVTNRFENYNDPYNNQQMQSNLDKLFSNYRNIINTQANQQTSDMQQGAMQSLASRGITGGSIINDNVSNIANQVNKSRLNALASLSQNEIGALNDLMRYANEHQLKKTGMAQNIDLANINNLFQKYGLLGNTVQGLNDDTWLDDTLGVLNTVGSVAGNVAPMFMGLPPMGILGSAGGGGSARSAKKR